MSETMLPLILDGLLVVLLLATIVYTVCAAITMRWKFLSIN